MLTVFKSFQQNSCHIQKSKWMQYPLGYILRSDMLIENMCTWSRVDIVEGFPVPYYPRYDSQCQHWYNSQLTKLNVKGFEPRTVWLQRRVVYQLRDVHVSDLTPTNTIKHIWAKMYKFSCFLLTKFQFK